MQSQRILDCHPGRLATTINNLHSLFAKPGRYDLFHQLIDQSLNVQPDQPRVNADEFARILNLLHRMQKDAGLGKYMVSTWVKILAENEIQSAPRDEVAILSMLDSFHRNNIAHISAGSYYNSKIKGILHSIEHKVGVNLTNQQISITAAALSQLNHTPKQHWELGAGTGKSFIIAAIAVLYLTQDAHARI